MIKRGRVANNYRHKQVTRLITYRTIKRHTAAFGLRLRQVGGSRAGISAFVGPPIWHARSVAISRDTRLIAVRNQAQAHDWALALLSQGIESTIVTDDAAVPVALEIEAAQCGAALRVLKQYHVENRGWGLRRELPVVHLAFNWACAGWALAVVILHYLAKLPQSRMVSAGILKPTALSADEWWRLFTAMTLHQDLGHLASNLVTGTLLLGLCMARHGTGLGLLAPWLAGALANLSALFIYGPEYQSLGASGMVLAALCVLTISGAREAYLRQPGWKPLFATLSAGLMLFVLTGSNPASDLVVHLGGFFFGLVVGGLVALAPGSNRHVGRLQSLALVAVLTSAAGAWLWALAR